ncbi:MAG: hypothetical protein E6J90_07730 [Deltaproteobacteria bacterium]|nr:MAG: hypothetical protein E6J90_07730 [Deltaproteobacteria bacterium]
MARSRGSRSDRTGQPPDARAGQRSGEARSFEQRVAELRALDPAAPASLGKLGTALATGSGFIVAAVAKLVEDHRLEPLVPELAPAFERLREDAVKRDPGCRGKLAIARALHALDHWDDRVFVTGLSHEQKEGWGQEDTAAELRGVCGIAHAHFARDDALDVLARLLADRERTARIGAAQAIGDAGRRDATALLRFKLLLGDGEPAVLAACLEAMFHLARDPSYRFAIELLAAHDERAEVAALALGGARFADAFEPLTAWCIGATSEQRHRIGYLALALLRAEPATAYLLDAIRSHGRRDAVAAARALATFKDDAGLIERIRDAAREQRDPAARDEIAELLA